MRRRTRRIWNYRRIGQAVRGATGLEIGGQSQVFSPRDPSAYIPPIYELARSIDNCNYAASTAWSEGGQGRTFRYLPEREPGLQFIHEASALTSIRDQSYDFVLSSHMLEHAANPLAALREFHRVLKPRGTALLLVPNRTYTFDHRRPYTEFEHLLEDERRGTTESDLTHLEEIVALHDLSMDAPAGTTEQFRARCMCNAENRCMHHHVFSLELLERAAEETGFKTLYATEAWHPHLLVFARRR